MDRVVITNGFVNVASMQVCATQDATDDEILEVCNRENPSGTSNGWSEVLRNADNDSMFKTKSKLPVTCGDDPNRTHFIVLC